MRRLSSRRSPRDDGGGRRLGGCQHERYYEGAGEEGGEGERGKVTEEFEGGDFGYIFLETFSIKKSRLKE